MAETQRTTSRVAKAVTVIVSLVGVALGLVSPSDATHD
jgi:hypothetical protein